MIKVVHVITGLATGGAEKMLLKLLTYSDPQRFSARVISLIPFEQGAAPIEALGVPLATIGMSRGWPNPLGVARLGRLLRASQPDLIQTWMYHADLIGGVAAKLAGIRAPVVWNIRHSTFDAGATRRRTAHVARVCAVASRWVPHTVVCCSIAAQDVHASLGYDPAKIKVIPNGFDLSQFRPDPVARQQVRAELGLPPNAFLIGRFGRFDPHKDYKTMVDAAGHLHRQRPDVHFVLCGLDVDHNNAALGSWIDAAGVRSVCHLLGYRRDVPRVMAALDLATSSSVSEAFPNVLGEAMACEVPCVTTDAGDSAYIVGDTGRVVPPRDPAALANAWEAMIAMGADGLRLLGREARRRVEAKFAIREVVRAYEDTYEAIVNQRGGPSRLTNGRYPATGPA